MMNEVTYGGFRGAIALPPRTAPTSEIATSTETLWACAYPMQIGL